MIQGVVGYPGQGKTLWMARRAEQDYRRRLPVAANFRLRGADYLGSFADILRWCATHPNGCVYIDEAGVVLNARNWARIPLEIQALFAQHRHYGLDLCWAAQRVGQVDKSLRELSQFITRVEKVFPGWPPSSRGGEYMLVPCFKADTYQMPDTKRVAWREWFFYSSRWALAYRTAEVLGTDRSEAGELQAAFQAWQGRAEAGEGLRIR